MTVDFNETPQDNPLTRETESPMFAPIPSWERGKKRSRLGARTVSSAPVAATIAAEPRSFAARPDTTDLRRPRTTRVIDEPVNEALMSRPLSPVRKTGNGVSPIALLAGIVVLGGLGAAGWYASQPREVGVAQLTPGQVTTTTVTTPVAPTQMAAVTPPAIATPAAAMPAAREPTVTVTRKTTATRQARASSVDDATMDTSATLPEAPMPYTGTAVNPTPAEAPPMTTPAPVEAAPATVDPAIPQATTATPPEAVTPVITPDAPATVVP
jgi:hypothetical protein